MPEHPEPRDLVDGLIPFVAHLVTVPGVTREPIPVGHLVTDLLPYRVHRRALGVISLDQYEAQLLRLCSGEGGYARLLPPELGDACRGALEGPDPGLSSVPGLENGRLVLLDRAWTLETEGTPAAYELRYTPILDEPPPAIPDEPPEAPEVEAPELLVVEAPESLPSPESGPTEESAVTPAPEIPDASPPRADRRVAPSVCPSCRFVLPDLDTLRFCPGCGAGVAPAGCPGCGETVLPAWRHCPSCGHRLGSSGLA